MTGHGGDVTSADWHPSQGLIASGSKDLLIKVRRATHYFEFRVTICRAI